jgi:hypothetical protein
MERTPGLDRHAELAALWALSASRRRHAWQLQTLANLVLEWSGESRLRLVWNITPTLASSTIPSTYDLRNPF